MADDAQPSTTAEIAPDDIQIGRPAFVYGLAIIELSRPGNDLARLELTVCFQRTVTRFYTVNEYLHKDKHCWKELDSEY